MHIVLVEPHFVGHRPTYLYLYSKLLLEAGHSVSVICTEQEVCRKFLNVEMNLPAVSVFPLQGSEKSAGFLSRYSFYDRYVLWKRLKHSLEGIENTDFVFFMYLDYFIFDFSDISLLRLRVNKLLNRFVLPAFIDRCLRVNWSGILFHPSAIRKDSKHFFRSKLNSSVCLLDETCGSDLGVRQVIHLPDVTDEQDPAVLSAMALDVLKRAKGRKVISLLGSLEKRKGLMPLLDVIALVDPGKYYFVIAGNLDVTFSKDELSRLERIRNAENCYLRSDGIPTEYDFNSLVKVSDILYLVYIGFYHSSNLLTKASLFRKPVLVSAGYCMGKRVNIFNTGLVLTDSSVVKIKDAIEHFDERFGASTAQYAEYFSLHSVAHLKEALLKVFENPKR